MKDKLETYLLGCEFVYCRNETDTPYRRFVHSVESRTSGIVVTDQNGLSWYLSEQLFYPDDYSDPIPYEEWVKLVITHDGVDKEVEWFDESTCINNSPPKKIKDVKYSKSSRCKDTIDWVEVEYGDAYEKPYVNKKPKKGSQSCKQSSQSCNQSISSTLVKQLTKSEIESLRQNKCDAYALMMKMN